MSESALFRRDLMAAQQFVFAAGTVVERQRVGGFAFDQAAEFFVVRRLNGDLLISFPDRLARIKDRLSQRPAVELRARAGQVRAEVAALAGDAMARRRNSSGWFGEKLLSARGIARYIAGGVHIFVERELFNLPGEKRTVLRLLVPGVDVAQFNQCLGRKRTRFRFHGLQHPATQAADGEVRGVALRWILRGKSVEQGVEGARVRRAGQRGEGIGAQACRPRRLSAAPGRHSWT